MLSHPDQDYRARIYQEYASRFQDAGPIFDEAASDRWGKAYNFYLTEWLPTDPEAQIGELGCGGGRLLHFFKRRGYVRLTGVDASPDQIALSRQVIRNVVQSDALTYLESVQNRFDLLIGLDIIEHFQKADVLRFLDLCYSALTPGGRLILQTPNAESPWAATHRYNDFTHEVCFNTNALSRLLSLAGFSEIEAREAGPIPFGYSMASSLRSFIWAAIRFGLKVWNLAETGTGGSGVYTRVFLISGLKK
jgi:2-polyprenyl-3-methyl-5-hydroxy-6-metoxy-1,4-benzoquinol methylase